jgi:hypothetical protein
VRFLKWISWWFLVCGLAEMVVGFGLGISNAVFLARSITTQGTIQELVPLEDRAANAINYAPVFTFMARNGRPYTIQSTFASNPPAFETGDSVRVLYIESDPTGARLGYFWQIWFATVMTIGSGALFSALGNSGLRIVRRRKQQTSPV